MRFRRFAAPLVMSLVAVAAMAFHANAQPADAGGPPQPSSEQLFLRWDIGPSGACDGPAYLSLKDLPDSGNSCGRALSILGNVPGQTLEDPFTLSMNPDETDVPLPITLDASRPLTGSIAISSIHPNDIKVDVKVTLDGTALPVQHIDAGLYTGSWFVDSQSPSFPFSVQIPASLDKTDVNDVKVEVIWRQLISTPELASAWVELDAPPSSITVPTYDSSWTVYCQTHTC